MKKTGGLIVSLGISGVAIVWLVSKIDLLEVRLVVQQMNLTWVAAAAGIYLIGFLPRGLRWQLMLSTVKQVSLPESTRVVVMGYAANNILPFRLGEVVRAYIMGNKNNISRTTCLGSIATERIIDGIVILLLLGGSMVFLPSAVQREEGLQKILLTGGVVFLAAVAVLALVLVFSEKIPGLWKKHIGTRGLAFIEKSIHSVSFLRSKHLLLQTISLSILVWLFEGLMFVLILWAMGIDNPVASGYFCFGIINLGILIPSAPGYVGVFQAASVFSFLALGHSEASGLAFGLLVHFLQFIPVTLVGIAIFLRYGYRFNEFYKAVSGTS
jgi:uncharacterized protein (TIRG00374 family)